MATQTQASFIEEATRAGHIDTARARELIQLCKSYQGQGVLRRIDEVAVDHGFLTTDQVEEIRSRGGRNGKAPQQRVGPYEDIEKIGAGGMAVVYRARDTRNGQVVALKVLHRRLSEDKDYLQRFYREAQAAARMHHPNIIRAFEAARTPEGQHYFAMEYVEGTTLNSWLKKAKLIPQREVVKIGVQVAKALDHAHSQGIVHRDVKPDNIMVTRDGRVKLTDLGLAKQYSDNRLTEIGIAVGTPQYISPEQTRGDRTIDIRSDIYSLGATMYHAATGHPPFTGNSAAIIMVKHLNERPVWPLEHNPTLLEATGQVLMKMLAKDPAERYQTPKELLRDLSAIYHGLKSSGSASVSAVQARGGTSSKIGPQVGAPGAPAASEAYAYSSNVGRASASQVSRGNVGVSPEADPGPAGPGRGKFMFLGVCITLALSLCVYTAINPQWLRVLASSIGLAKPPSEIVDHSASPVAKRRPAQTKTKAVRTQAAPRPATVSKESPPPRPPRTRDEIPLVSTEGAHHSGRTDPAQQTPTSEGTGERANALSRAASAGIERARGLVADGDCAAAYALLSGLKDAERPDANGVYSYGRTVLEGEMDHVRASAEVRLTSEIKRAEEAIRSNDAANARQAIAAARPYLALGLESQYAGKLSELTGKVDAPKTALTEADRYRTLYDQYTRITGLVSDRDYEQALHFLRTLRGAHPQEVALWEEGIRDVRDTFLRAEANAPRLIGTKVQLGGVSGKVVSVQDGKVYLQTGEVRVARPLSELSESQRMELAGVRFDAGHPDLKVKLGVFAFFHGKRSLAEAHFKGAEGSRLRLARLRETLGRMDELTRERHASQLLAEAGALAKAGDWREARKRVRDLRTDCGNTRTFLDNVAAIAVIEKQIESESLESVLAGRATRKDPYQIESTYDFRDASELTDWWRSGNGVLKDGGGLTVNGDFWMGHRVAYTRLRRLEVHFRVDKLLDPANSFVGWGIHAAAQVTVPTAIDTELPRGFYGTLNALQGRESGIWVGGDRPKVFAITRQDALKPARDYVLTVTHSNDLIAWAVNGEIFLKAKDLGRRAGPRTVLFASQVQMTISKVVVDGNVRSDWLAEAKKTGEFLGSEIPSLRRKLAEGETVSLLHRGLPVLWSAAPGEWKAANGGATWSGYYNAPPMRLPFAVKNGVIEMKFRYDKADKLQRGFELTFRDTGASRYALRINPAKAELAVVRYYCRNGIETEEILRQSLATEIAGDLWHPVAVAFKDSRIHVSFHNTPVLTYSEARVVEGEVALVSVNPGKNSSYDFTDFTLREYK